MPLFQNHRHNGQHSHHGQRRDAQPQVIVIQQPERLPEFFHRLSVLCRSAAHPLPCAMKHIGDATSDKGFPMAIYACPLCNTREGYVRDFATGKPRQLFTKPGNSH